MGNPTNPPHPFNCVLVTEGNPTVSFPATTQEGYEEQFHNCAKLNADAWAREGRASRVDVYVNGTLQGTYIGRA